MKANNPVAESREEIEELAADFLQRRRFGKWNADDEAELDAWLAASEARRLAFLRLEAGLARIERLSALRAPKPRRGTRVARLRFMIPYLATAMSLGLIAVVGLAVERSVERPVDRSFATDVGGRASLKFADGTQMVLNTDTAMRFRMTAEERTVWLERGEAWFRVAHDAAHPFTVVVGNHRIVDLGTEFLVRRDADALKVALVQGRAEVSAEGAQTATLSPGDEAIATPVSMFVTRKSPQELADELAWERGVIVLRHTRLDAAAREFNRYNRTKLVIADPAVAAMTIGGDFRADNLEDFLRLTEAILKLRAEQTGKDILLARATDSVPARSIKAANRTHGQ